MGNSSPEYKSFFLPSPVGGSQTWVGDVMPYYEDGTFYIYYLKDGGDSYNHSIFLVTSKDLATFTEHPGPIMEAAPGRDLWMGTGSVVKAGEKYYLFYTAHNSSPKFELDEVIRVAEGTSPTSFKKREDWILTPPPFLGQRIDFRDPQGYYDPASDTIALTVTASHQNTAKALKFTVSGNLMARKLCRKENGDLYLMPVDAVLERFQTPAPLLCDQNETVAGGNARAYVPAIACRGSFMIKGKFRFDGRGSLGLAFDANGEPGESAHLSVDSTAGRIRLTRGRKTVAEVAAEFEAGHDYDFSYIQEGTLGIFTVNAAASLTVRVPSAENLNLRIFARAGTAVFSNLHALTPSKIVTL